MSLNELWDSTGRLIPIEEIDGWIEDERRKRTVLPEVHPRSTVLGLFGPRGSGKSLIAAKMAWDRYISGRPVFYNPRDLLRFPARKGCTAEFKSLRDVALMDERMKGSLFLWDEAQRSLSKFRASSSVSYLLGGALQQTRKLGIDIIVTSNAQGQLDSILTEQMDIHGILDGKLEERLQKRIPYGDYAIVQFTDTHGKMGKGPPRFGYGAHADTRLRMPRKFTHLSSIFPIFNTDAKVDPLDVLGLTADEMRLAMEERDAGINIDDLARWVRVTLIPDLVIKEGANALQPAALTTWIEEHYTFAWDHTNCCGSLETKQITSMPVKGWKGKYVECDKGTPMPFKISDSILGKALKMTGLKARGTARGQVYRLPPPDQIDKFMNGMWSQDE